MGFNNTRWGRRKNQHTLRQGNGIYLVRGEIKIEDSLRGLWGRIKQTNIHNVRIPEGEKGGKEAENVFET